MVEDTLGVSRGTLTSHYRIRQDEAELLGAVVEEQSKIKRRTPTVRMASRVDLHAAADRMEAIRHGGGPEDDYVGRMGRLIRKYDIQIPTVQVTFRDVHITTNALMGSKAVPTVGRSFTNLMRSLVFMPETTTPVTVIDHCSGVLVPGRLTLLLGPPSSGKTSFLRYLCGRLSSNTVEASGAVEYNGRALSEFDAVRTTAFCGQFDEHIPQCTVGETLEFAHTCTHGQFADMAEVAGMLEAALAAKGVTLESVTQRAQQEGCDIESVTTNEDGDNIHDEVALLVAMHGLRGSRGVRIMTLLRMLGMEHTLDTPVGDAMLRGISGGERKRLTILEMIMGARRALFLDEISTGLDSATLFSIIRALRRYTNGMSYMTIVSLLQPPPEVFWEFDDLLLMADGKIAWHGPVGEVIGFFASLGFVCPSRKDVPSFLQEVVTYTGQLDYASEELLEERGFPGRAFPIKGRRQYVVPIDEIRAAFWAHPAGQAQKKLLDTPFEVSKGHPAALRHGKYALTSWQTLVVVVRRQWLLMFKDPALIRGRLIQSTVVGLIVGGLFYGLPKTETGAPLFFGASYMIILFTSMGAMIGLTTALQTKGVWLKHRDNQFYPAWAHATALTITQLPLQCLDVLVWTVLTYFMVGYTYAAGRFFTNYLISVAVACCFGAMFRAIGHLSPDVVAAQTYGTMLLMVLTAMSGYTIPVNEIPPWWIWAYWMSPYSWAVRAMVVNEMTSPDWSEPAPRDPSLTMGQFSLNIFSFQPEYYWVWAGVAFLFGVAALMTGISSLALEYLGGPAKVTAIPDEVELAKARAKADARKVSVVSTGSSGAPTAATSESPHITPHRMSTEMSAARSSTTSPDRDESAEACVMQVDAHTAGGKDGGVAGMASFKAPSGGIPFEPITLVWQNLQYFVPNPSKTPDAPAELELLKGITGWAKPGELTALMGGSGAGKTTLMDCIAGRKTVGVIKGDITVNGHAKDQATWSRVMGYVEQMDIHTAAQTIIEALLFSARLRLPSSVTDNEMRDYVDQVVELVDLTEIMFNLVGTPGMTGLSVEQRKRLTIANEMVANPSVIFMDEPTSGLDARAAAIVMRAVRNVGNSNRAVVVTIHQPSIEIFEAFDNLLLMQRGGRTAYFGQLGFESSKLVGYLQAVPGCEPVKDGVNPATWMLEVTGGAVSVTVKKLDVDWPQLYAGSALGEANTEYASSLVAGSLGTHSPLTVAGFGPNGRYAAPLSTQIGALFRKFFSAYWRMPNYNYVRYVTAVVIAVVYGSIFYKQGRLADPTDTTTVQSIGGLVYLTASMVGMSSMMAVMPLFGGERVVYYREQAAQYYNPWAYGLVMSLVEVPYQVVQAVVFVSINYWMVAFIATADHFFYYLFMTLLSLMMYVSLGMALTYSSPSQQLAMISATGLNFLFNIFNGYVLPYPFIAQGFKWVNRIVPTTWVIYGLVSDQLAGSDVTIVEPAGDTFSVSEFMRRNYGYDYSFRLWCLLIVGAYIIVLRIVSVLALRYMSFLRR
ncbi:hypothetical protein FOA52_000943 [Chlamydomonas sp. UWO 241]|nr:hypothetical protein FOA52_000943 [Chlamydomonas sp. UWO 241]